MNNKKIISIFVACLCFATLAIAQGTMSTRGLSSRSALLLYTISDKYDASQIAEEYGLVQKHGTYYVQGIGSLNAGVGEEQLAQYGAQIVSSTGRMKRIDVELDHFKEFAAAGVCEYFDIGPKVTPRMDRVRGLTMAWPAHKGINLSHGYNGTGVVVGVIDAGFQPDHPAYLDTTRENLRIKRLWNQADNTATPPDGFDYGSEYNTPEAITDSPRQRDDAHGTHTSTTAAGIGSPDSVGSKYRGIAYNSDIILVRYHNSFLASQLFDGIKYIRDYASSQNKPCVVNMSLGSDIGPRDGTSAFDMMCSEYLTNRPDSCILVGAASNDADFHNHLGKTFAEGDTIVKTIFYSMYPYNMDIWSDSNSTFSAQVSLVDKNDGTVVDSTGFIAVDSMDVTTSRLSITESSYLDLTMIGSYSPYNKCRNMLIKLTSHLGYNMTNYHIVLSLKGKPGNKLHAWANYGAYFNGDETIGAVEGDSEYTVNEIGGTGKHVVSVGAYDSRSIMEVFYPSHPLEISYNKSEEESLSYFSSHGPTVDGRTKPEVTAPGNTLFAPFNRNYQRLNQLHICDTIQNNGRVEYFGAMTGTSASTPVVSGIIALWLQENPTLNYDDVISLIQSDSFVDSTTGTIPPEGSNLWGWGKINAYAGLPGRMPNRHHVVLKSNLPDDGIVSGSGYYPDGEKLKILAMYNGTGNNQFLHWSDGSTEAVRTIIVESDTMLIAYFSGGPVTIETPRLEAINVTVSGKTCNVKEINNKEVTIYDVIGRPVTRGRGDGSYRLPSSGVYFVVCDGWKPTKIVIL